jgi:hypothetical protein
MRSEVWLQLARYRASVTAAPLDLAWVPGHFQVLAADERFAGMRIGLNRNPGEDLLFAYEIVANIEDQNLDVAADLADFAVERGLGSRFGGVGQVAMFRQPLT